jgi:hypothetical protein
MILNPKHDDRAWNKSKNLKVSFEQNILQSRNTLQNGPFRDKML